MKWTTGVLWGVIIAGGVAWVHTLTALEEELEACRERHAPVVVPKQDANREVRI